MNAHIAKPINVTVMYDTLSRILVPSKIHVITENNDTEHVEFPVNSISGVDLQKGLLSANYNLALYQKHLLKFAEKYRQFAHTLRTLMEEYNHADLTREIHTLKGLAGSIGAQTLYQDAEILERKLNTNTHIEADEATATVLESLQRVVSSIDAVEAQLTAIDSPKIDSMDIETFTARLHQLLNLLDDYDTEAVDVVEELIRNAKGLSQEVVSELECIAKALRLYDFETATTHLNKLLNIV